MWHTTLKRIHVHALLAVLEKYSTSSDVYVVWWVFCTLIVVQGGGWGRGGERVFLLTLRTEVSMLMLFIKCNGCWLIELTKWWNVHSCNLNPGGYWNTIVDMNMSPGCFDMSKNKLKTKDWWCWCDRDERCIQNVSRDQWMSCNWSDRVMEVWKLHFHDMVCQGHCKHNREDQKKVIPSSPLKTRMHILQSSQGHFRSFWKLIFQ